MFILFFFPYLYTVIPELAANDQLMKFWMSIAKPDVSCRNYSPPASQPGGVIVMYIYVQVVMGLFLVAWEGSNVFEKYANVEQNYTLLPCWCMH